MDEIDKKLLLNLEKDARVSLKNLAKELNVKTSTIYHRLHKLKEANILNQFTIVINPAAIGLKIFSFINIKIKNLVIGSLDTMFLGSFAKFLAENYDCIVFCAVGSDNVLHMITAFQDNAEFTAFKDEIEKNPYVAEVQVIPFTETVKGQKIFNFPKNIAIEEQAGNLFDSGEEEEEEIDEEDEDADASQELEFSY
jgi:DNA-binding Lrp family transcriptional regulator